MAKKINKLSDAFIRSELKSGRYCDGDGLWLQVSRYEGTKAWLFRFMLNRKEHRMGLGSLNRISLAQARKLAKECRELLVMGKNPIEERRKERRHSEQAAEAITFKQAVDQFLAVKTQEFQNPKHIAQWRSTLDEYAVKIIGKLKVAEIDERDVEKCLKPIWTTKTETASRLRGRIEAVLAWATATKHRTGENPARWKGNLEFKFQKPTKIKKVEHHAALPYAEIGTFMADLRKRDGISPRALEFAILTAARSGEVRGATWSEIDLETRIWTIPAERMKAKKEHVVPLSAEAVALLGALPRIEDNPLVFPAPRGSVMSDMSLTAVLKRMERGDLTQHGFRSTFREWAGETTAHPREVIEHALAHKLKDKAEAAYQRGTLLPKRAVLMADWGKFCGYQSAEGNVVSLRAANA